MSRGVVWVPRTRGELQTSLRLGEQTTPPAARAAHLQARRRRTAWRSLRARTEILEQAVLEPVESAEPFHGAIAVQLCGKRPAIPS